MKIEFLAQDNNETSTRQPNRLTDITLYEISLLDKQEEEESQL